MRRDWRKRGWRKLPRFRIGKTPLPLWALVVLVLVLPAAAGQAVGPVLTGGVTSGAPVAVAQAITLDASVPQGSNPGFGNQNILLGEANEPQDGVTARGDDGTSFTVGAEINAGDRIAVNLYFSNRSGAEGAALLEITAPRGLSIDVAEIGQPADGGSNVNAAGGPIASNVVREARTGATTWLLAVGASAGAGDDDGVTLILQSQGSAGFFVVTGTIKQISS